ncbi:flavin-containing monooxygenase [Geodermatophilus sp. SYSU D00758]
MAAEHVDVLIVGAGLSGIGAACHLQRENPGTGYAILEAREAIGGTWDLFRYPGVRSDSDMYTLGYDFKPWTGERSIAEGGDILAYIRETAREHDVERHVRFGHRVVAAEWSSEQARWTVTATGPDGAPVELTCSWLSVCSGYYRYDEGFRPAFPGEEDYRGRLVHPQHWPADLDVTGKRVVVIGSGATAVTLVPSLAETAEHVTMLQRTPSYVMALPGRDPLATALRRRLPEGAAATAVRWKNVLVSTASYQFARRRPEAMRRFLAGQARKQLPAGYDVDTHFGPPYDPWDQRLCLSPDGDLFAAVRAGRAAVVTDRIARFTEHGIALESGPELPADVVVTATGLQLLPIGGMTLAVDGEPVDLAQRVSYKGFMVSGVPNLSMTLGYTNASWTLKADLIARSVCRLLRHMAARGHEVCTPVAPAEGGSDPFLPLTSGYVQRSVAALPKQGRRAPWRLYQNYLRDLLLMRLARVEDEGLRFSRRAAVPAPAGVAA